MSIDVLEIIARFGFLILTIVTTIVAIRKPILRNEIEVKFFFRSKPKDKKDDEQKKIPRRKSHKNKKE